MASANELDKAIEALRILNEETVLAGFPGGDRMQTLASVRAMANSHAALMEAARALKRLRERHAKWKKFMEWSASDTLLMAESGAALAELEKAGIKL